MSKTSLKEKKIRIFREAGLINFIALSQKQETFI